jgi:dolichol-phosphate mannosyltransferase
LTVVVPVYNEGEMVVTAYEAIRDALESGAPDLDYEVCFVDDGSSDDSFEYIEKIASDDERVHGIKFAVNCGSQSALRAGFEHCDGDIGTFVPCDLQEAPELIPRMLAKLEGKVQIVAAVRNSRQDPWHSRLFAVVFYFLARLLVSKNITPGGTGMFLLGSKALTLVKSFSERNMSFAAMLASTGLVYDIVYYDRQPRLHGTTKWTFAKKLELFADFFVASSYVPIRLMSVMGICVAGLGFLYAIFLILNRLFFSAPVVGWTATMVVVLVLGGVQMTMLGVIGEYLWRTLDEVRARPRYVIEKTVGHKS